MKKNISINISGIIFHIEEDGYEILRNYLESISRYFASYEDNKEIIEDIEGRIAEIFLSKLSSSKEVITQEDVEAVVAKMGNIADFEAAEDTTEQEEARQHKGRTYTHAATDEPKRLVRDTKRRIVGGVASGIAYYFGTDPLWIRLLILVLLFSDIFISAGAITFITYIIFWIVVPGRDDLQSDEKIKKLFRNPDDRVVGGVAGGIAAYFGTDTTLIRLLFVLSIFLGGFGIIAYIVLWIITPEAKSLTDKMQMSGEPVTLANIEHSVKKNLNVNENEEENTFTKVLLFPFRLIATIFNGLGKVAGPFLMFLGQIARIIAGLILLFMGLGLMFVILVASGVAIGLFTADMYSVHGNIPLDTIRSSIPELGLIAAFITIFIPALAIVLSGVAVIAKRKVVSAPLGWSALGLWFISIAILSFTIPPVVMDFREDARYTETQTYNLVGTTPVLTLKENGNNYDATDLRIQGHADSVLTLEKAYRARGKDFETAQENAQMIDYQVEQTDSTFAFPSTFAFKEGAEFRAQELDMTLYIPYGQPFMMDRALREILSTGILYTNNLSVSDMEGNTFMFTSDGLECITCEGPENLDDQFEDYDLPGNFSRDFEVEGFENLDISGAFKVEVFQGDTFKVTVTGREEDVERIEVKVRGDLLEVEKEGFLKNTEDLGILITMPALESVKFQGATQATISKFVSENLHVDLAGAANVTLAVEAQELDVDMSSAAKLQLFGTADFVDINMGGAAQLEASELVARRAELKLGGASRARVNATETLDVDAGTASRVEYTGDAAVTIENGQGRNVEKF